MTRRGRPSLGVALAGRRRLAARRRLLLRRDCPLAIGLAALFVVPLHRHVGQARVERARGDRPAPGRRRPLLRGDEPDRDAAARAGARARRARRRRACCRWSRWRSPPGSPRAGSAPTAAASSSTSPGFLVLWLRLRRVPAAQAVAATAVAAAAALALVGIDAATGGSSHVTKAVGGGPGAVARRPRPPAPPLGGGDRIDLERGAPLRDRASVALVWLALRRPRLAVLDALPRRARDLVARQRHAHRRRRLRRPRGARPLGCWTRSEERAVRLRVDSRRMRRLALLLGVCSRSCSPAAAAGRRSARPRRRSIGTVRDHDHRSRGAPATRRPVPRSSRHRAAAAATRSSRPGTNGNGRARPRQARRATRRRPNQGSLDDFTHESIANPSAYVEKGYQNDDAATSAQTLSAKQIADLVAYLTQTKG